MNGPKLSGKSKETSEAIHKSVPFVRHALDRILHGAAYDDVLKELTEMIAKNFSREEADKVCASTMISLAMSFVEDARQMLDAMRARRAKGKDVE